MFMVSSIYNYTQKEGTAMTDNNLMDNMWEIFKIRVEALQNINPKMFVDNQKPVSFLSNLEKDGPKDALIKASLVAQAYITTKKQV